MTQAGPIGLADLSAKLLLDRTVERWRRFLMDWWRIIFAALVAVFAIGPGEPVLREQPFLILFVVYVGYVAVLLIFRRANKPLYDSRPARLVRIQLDILLVTVILLLGHPGLDRGLWLFFALPILAALFYFDSPLLSAGVFVEICVAMTFSSLWLTKDAPLNVWDMGSRYVLLLLLAGMLYYLTREIPRLRDAAFNADAAEALLSHVDSAEIPKVLAEAAAGNIPRGDGAVVHLLDGPNPQALIPRGASQGVDITRFGRTPMPLGVGIAGHALARPPRRQPRRHTARPALCAAARRGHAHRLAPRRADVRRRQAHRHDQCPQPPPRCVHRIRSPLFAGVGDHRRVCAGECRVVRRPQARPQAARRHPQRQLELRARYASR